MSSRVVRVKSWEEFKKLIVKHKPESIAYNIEQGVPAKHLTSLRLILPTRGTHHVFIDKAVLIALATTVTERIKPSTLFLPFSSTFSHEKYYLVLWMTLTLFGVPM